MTGFKALVLLVYVVLRTVVSGLYALERRLGVLVAVRDDVASSGGGTASTSSKATDLQPGAKLPVQVAHTYRNAYGTHFACSSTWKLLLGMYVVLVIGGLLLMSVIPVRFASKEKLEAPLVLWFGSPKKDGKAEKKREEDLRGEEAEKENLWHRATSWMIQSARRFFVAAPSRDVDMRYRFHADMTQQLAASASTAKVYDSIAVATDDLEVKMPMPPLTYDSIAVSTDDLGMKPSPLLEAPSEDVLTDDLEVRTRPAPRIDDNVARAATELKVESPPSRALVRLASRSSIFMAAPPSPPSAGRMRLGSARLASDASSAKAETIGHRTSRVGSGSNVVETREDFMRAASHRQSIAARAERRVALAREDVCYENLEDDEMRVYEYLEFVRELLDGLALKKICQKSGRIVSRKLYITTDMQVVFWNSIGTIKRQSKKSSLRTVLIESVQKGIHGSANAMTVSSAEQDIRCVSIRCSDGKCLALEAKTESMRQRLYFGFSRLAQEHQQQHSDEATGLVVPTIPEE